ncbi:MAG: RluA family pseudouridine synthase [Muribaculaceae bacterium]|nr:RluA family pseudouridine synthase [Muribaculaceae bacterium]
MRKERHHSGPAFREDRIVAWNNEGTEAKQLLDFVIEKAKDFSRTDAKSWLKHGQIKLNGQITTAFNAVVEPGSKVEVNLGRPFVTLKHPRLKIIYEDDDVIVVDKGYGLLSVGIPGAGKKRVESAYDILRDYLKKKDPRNKLFVVHRLDRDTSGVMMFAKTQEAQETLRHNWNNFVLERLYITLLEGFVKEDEGVIKSRLAENSQYLVYSTDREDEGKLAVTRFKVKGRGHGLSLVEFMLDTGRKNQIRVHASEMGHPIMGDRKYGAKQSRIGRLCLHANTLRFAHPVTKKDMYFESPVPPAFYKAIRY